MKSAIQTSSLVVAGLIASLAIADSQPAQAALLTWNLTFESGGVQVGTGEFTYDTDQVALVRQPMPYSAAYVADKDAPLREDFVPPAEYPGLWTVTRYANPVVNFVARFPEVNWTLTNIAAWFDPSTPGILGYFGCSRYGCYTSNTWFGGSPSGAAPGQFLMDNARALDNGSYTGWFISVPIPGTSNSIRSGTWTATATAVPEPATIAGAVLFGAGCLVRKWRSQ